MFSAQFLLACLPGDHLKTKALLCLNKKRGERIKGAFSPRSSASCVSVRQWRHGPLPFADPANIIEGPETMMWD